MGYSLEKHRKRLEILIKKTPMIAILTGYAIYSFYTQKKIFTIKLQDGTQ